VKPHCGKIPLYCVMASPHEWVPSRPNQRITKDLAALPSSKGLDSPTRRLAFSLQSARIL
jgi:hypothetical protein